MVIFYTHFLWGKNLFMSKNLEKGAHILIMVIWIGSLNYLLYKLVFWSFVFFKTNKRRKEAWSHKSWKSLQREHGLTDTLILDFWLQHCKRINFCCFHPSNLRYLVTVVSGKLIQGPNNIYKLPLVILSLESLIQQWSPSYYHQRDWVFLSNIPHSSFGFSSLVGLTSSSIPSVNW